MKSHKFALQVAVVVLILAELLGLAGVISFPHDDLKAALKYGHPFLGSAFLGTYVMVMVMARNTRARLAMTGAGLIVEAFLVRYRGHFPLREHVWGVLQNFGFGLGVIAVLFALSRVLGDATTTDAEAADLGQDEPKTVWTRMLWGGLLMPSFIVLSGFLLNMTVLLHPSVLDPFLVWADQAFGTQVSIHMGAFANKHTPWLMLLIVVYLQLPLACSVVFAGERRKRSGDTDVLTSFVMAGVLGWVVYHLCPVIGPRPYFTDYPNMMPTTAGLVPASVTGVSLDLRNCVPSLHTAWGLLVCFHARRLGRGFTIFGCVFFALTECATLALGQHYVIDLVVAFPFTMVVRSLFRPLPWSHPARYQALAFGVLFTTLWLMCLRIAGFVTHPPLVLTLAILSVSLTVVLEVRLTRAVNAWLASPDAAAIEAREAATERMPARSAGREVYALLAAFVFSGFAGLVYEVVFAKELALTFGSTAKASNTVLATYMGGLALGSYFGARLAAKYKHFAIRIYAFSEAGVALACITSPWIFRGIRALYVSLASGVDPQKPGLIVLQVALGALALLPPTILMGMTMPALATHLERRKESLGSSIGLLYGANTLGAAAGALLTGYLILPSLGVFRTTALAAVLNILAAGVALALGKFFPRAAEITEASVEVEAPVTAANLRATRVALSVLFVGGLVTLALETTYIHLLAVVAGNSAYAFSLMLFAFLLGLGGGSAFGRAWLKRELPLRTGIVLFQALLCISALAGVFLWNAIPDYFGQFYGFPLTTTFATREFVRFIVCALCMLPVALAIGAIYPLTMEMLTRANPSSRLVAMGKGMAINTAGNIVGALLGGFVLLPAFESLRTLQLLVCVSALLAAVVTSLPDETGLPPKFARGLEIGGFALASLLLVAQPHSLDFTKLSTGANVYFAQQGWGEVVDHAESVDGGLTTVARSFRQNQGEAPHEVLTLLTNGKFQGDNDPGGEMQAQLGFALVPLTHTTKRGKVLIVGLGTGATARTLSDAGFGQVDIAELSGDIARLADKHFERVNAKVLNRPAVHLKITDGRNYLMLTENRFDLISMEITSIWFAGAASLYNREFYELARSRLAEGGVLQQWIQLHRLSREDIASVLATLHEVFPHVWVYEVGRQGIIIACQHDCSPDQAAHAAIEKNAALRPALAFYGGRTARIAQSRIMDTPALERFLAESSRIVSYPISTDDNLFLEYHSPRGNVRDYAISLEENLAMLRAFTPASPQIGTHLPLRFFDPVDPEDPTFP